MGDRLTCVSEDLKQFKQNALNCSSNITKKDNQ